MTTPTFTYKKLLTGVLALGFVFAGCSGSETNGEAEGSGPVTSSRTVRVETLVLQPSGFQDVIELTGTVEATNDATLSAQSAGTVVSLAERGQAVRAGQTIAQLDPGIARASVAQAEASVAAAQAQFDLAADNLRRQEPLFRDSVISAIEFENVRAQHNAAQAQLAQARAVLAQATQQLGYSSVTTPFAGVVEDRLVERGEQVMPGTPVVRVVSTGLVKVTAGVPERYAGDINVGTDVQIAFQAAGIAERAGRVTFVGSAIDPQSRTFPVEIAIENQDGRLKPQMVARVQIAREQLDNVIVVPRSAVLTDENGTSVYIVTRSTNGAIAERRDVVLGSAYGTTVVVQTGLQAGDEVVVLGQNNLIQGDALEIAAQHESVAATQLTVTE
jgi:membrane fusion protein, multidrug efflux system